MIKKNSIHNQKKEKGKNKIHVQNNKSMLACSLKLGGMEEKGREGRWYQKAKRLRFINFQRNMSSSLKHCCCFWSEFLHKRFVRLGASRTKLTFSEHPRRSQRKTRYTLRKNNNKPGRLTHFFKNRIKTKPLSLSTTIEQTQNRAIHGIPDPTKTIHANINLSLQHMILSFSSSFFLLCTSSSIAHQNQKEIGKIDPALKQNNGKAKPSIQIQIDQPDQYTLKIRINPSNHPSSINFSPYHPSSQAHTFVETQPQFWFLIFLFAIHLSWITKENENNNKKKSNFRKKTQRHIWKEISMPFLESKSFWSWWIDGRTISVKPIQYNFRTCQCKTTQSFVSDNQLFSLRPPADRIEKIAQGSVT